MVESCEGVSKGSTWQSLEVEGASTDREAAMLVDPHMPMCLYRSEYGTIYRGDDGGRTWPI
jgi:hypothetical protein